MRAHRVCFVTADEAEYLNRNGKNEIAKCCPHLWTFHSHGRREDGSEWSSCWIQGCHCTTETPPDRLHVLHAEQDKAIEQVERRNALAAFFLLGAAACGAVWTLTAVLS